jgi:hypothetical protein
VLQNLSNDVEFGSKEPYMVKMNDFIQSNRAKLVQFYDKVVVCPVIDGGVIYFAETRNQAACHHHNAKEYQTVVVDCVG